MTMSTKVDKFCVLMSIYHADVPDHSDENVDSIINQTLSPDEIISVKDGPVGEELKVVIEKWANEYPALFRIVSLTENQVNCWAV